MAYPETGPLNPLMAEINKEINPVSLSNLLFSPRTSGMSCLLQVSPDLHHRHPWKEVKHVLEPASVRVSQCVLVCVFRLFPLSLTSLSLFTWVSVLPSFHFPVSFLVHSVVPPDMLWLGTHQAQTVALLCAGITDSFCTLSGRAAVLAPPPRLTPPTPLCTDNNGRN